MICMQDSIYPTGRRYFFDAMDGSRGMLFHAGAGTIAFACTQGVHVVELLLTFGGMCRVNENSQ